MNALGYDYLKAEAIDDAVKIFTLYTREFPESATAFDSLGEAFFKGNDLDLALENYRKSLELNPRNANAEQWIKTIEESAGS